ncbi:phospholipid carrier-dependent glycosyltransferase [Baaleninema sp.]|uniref:phospholipid carrier-dependent glycosyltransferase n=1 Tax=Baaleninema sp. TaxID=3101197 RepID=UPI003D030474
MKKLWTGLLGIWVGSLILRFWELDRFNVLVFDEIYFANYGFNYLKQIPFFDVHPPLGKYCIALGIWIQAHFMGGLESLKNATEVAQLNAFAYRWANGLVGATVPLLVGSIAYEITLKKRYAFLSSLFVALDGLLLVESRYALINVYLLGFGLLGVLTFFKSLNSQKTYLWAMVSGVFLGCCASVKWNGLGFWLGIVLLYGGAWALRYFKLWSDRAASHANSDLKNSPEENLLDPLKSPFSDISNSGENDFKNIETEGINPEPLPPQKTRTQPSTNPLESILKIDRLNFALNFGLVPFLVYRLLWIPHLQLNPDFTFLGMQWQILHYHESIGNTTDAHPYCSAWYSWPWMARPVGYYFQAIEKASQTLIFDVHAFGNPPLWWLSAVAIAAVTVQLFRHLLHWRSNRPVVPQTVLLHSLLVSEFAANFLPWAKVSRCTYLYHYMGASLFAFMALAWWVDNASNQRDLSWRIVGTLAVAIIVLGFWYWLPIYLGLPLTREAFDGRMWWRSWY